MCRPFDAARVDVYLYQSRGSIDARTVHRQDVILRVSEQLLLAERPGQAQLQAP
jgi:hypothetical protein